MKILLICDHYPLPPRVNNMRKTLEKYEHDVTIFAWNRTNKAVNDKRVITLNSDIGYGNQFRKLLNLPIVFYKLRKVLKNENFDVIHAIDFEFMMLARFAMKKEKLVYEVFDIKFFNNKIVNRVREIIEFYCMKRIAGVIFASPFFSKYYCSKYKIEKPSIVINNKPTYNEYIVTDSGFMNDMGFVKSNKNIITFVGLIRYKNILERLISVVSKMDDYLLILAGDGPDLPDVMKFVKEHNIQNVFFTGRFETKDLYSIYKNSDVIWASYPNDDLNVKYAVSNKFFESQLYNRKIIVSENTFLAEEVLRSKLGLSVNPYSIDSIKTVLIAIRDLERSKQDNLELLWDDEEYRILNFYKIIQQKNQ